MQSGPMLLPSQLLVALTVAGSSAGVGSAFVAQADDHSEAAAHRPSRVLSVAYLLLRRTSRGCKKAYRRCIAYERCWRNARPPTDLAQRLDALFGKANLPVPDALIDWQSWRARWRHTALGVDTAGSPDPVEPLSCGCWRCSWPASERPAVAHSSGGTHR
ncbi:hypothetical protein ACVBEG_27125 [Pseudomonas sp. GG8]